MDKYVLIDMFEKLDASLLEELHLEKDLKRHKKTIRRLFANGHVKIASIIAGVSLFATGILIVLLRVKRRYFRRRPA